MTSGEGRIKEYTLGDPTDELHTFAVTQSGGLKSKLTDLSNPASTVVTGSRNRIENRGV